MLRPELESNASVLNKLMAVLERSVRERSVRERFEHYPAHYKRSGYKETEARVEFIDPFFEALGRWL